MNPPAPGPVSGLSAIHETRAAPPAAYQDTILKVDANMYTRTLRHGIVVTYDGIGRHVKTTNRAAQVTTFTYVGSTDSLLTVQVPGDTNRYVVGYTGSGATRKVDKLTDPAGRILDLTVNTTTGSSRTWSIPIWSG